MDSEWLSKALNSYLECIEQVEFDWQHTNSFFDESEEVWFDHAAIKFRQHYLEEIRKKANSFIDEMNQQYEILKKALELIEDAELKKRTLNIHFDGFYQACADEEELISVSKTNIKKTEVEVDAARQKMHEVHGILSQIS